MTNEFNPATLRPAVMITCDLCGEMDLYIVNDKTVAAAKAKCCRACADATNPLA